MRAHRDLGIGGVEWRDRVELVADKDPEGLTTRADSTRDLRAGCVQALMANRLNRPPRQRLPARRADWLRCS
ncbi:MAG TPA: hypothetical protein DCE44_00580 [Verrucomicrobiales bacterium]|nr:hypothetical protein [Verrucomicrobiales bacterium]